jgi:hypothetical protein
MATLADFWKPFHSRTLPEFAPGARYFAALDCLIYLRESCSYRAFRLNEYTTVLLHPYEDRPVGVKLKGVRFLYRRANAILSALYPNNMKERQNDIGLAMLWEVALTATGERRTAEAEAERQGQLAERARKEIVQQAGVIPAREFEEAA